jgi:xanthine/uracil permease
MSGEQYPFDRDRMRAARPPTFFETEVLRLLSAVNAAQWTLVIFVATVSVAVIIIALANI